MVLRAVLIAISLLVTAIIYSDIIEEEMNYDDQESEATSMARVCFITLSLLDAK